MSAGRRRNLAAMAVLALLAAARIAMAQVGGERSGSILFFPKIIADGTADTTIQLSNQANAGVSARCFYLRATPFSFGERTTFVLFLTPLQPTHWLASAGRPVDSSDPPCGSGLADCNGAGFDPGDVPATPPGFRGALLCIEVDTAGQPLTGNDLSGVATLQQVHSGGVSKYNAIGIAGNPDSGNGGAVLCLGTPQDPTCAGSGQYGACPQSWILTHMGDGAEDPGIGPASTVRTNVAILPCAQDLQTQAPTQITAQFVITNELEQTLSASTTVTRWADLSLSSISPAFTRGMLGTDYAQTRISPASASGGFVVVAEESRSAEADSVKTSAMLTPHSEGAHEGADMIVIPNATP